METKFNYKSPGRVNLIGEHTDYNGGYVFPCALSMGTYGAASRRGDEIIGLSSANFDLRCEAQLSELVNDPAHDWANYPKGVAAEFQKMGHKIGGFDLFVKGDIPNGAGLSSSASLLVLTAVVINDLFGCGLSAKEIALLTQRVENDFIGVNCGIMDQYAVSFGRKDHALLLDCNKIEHEYVPLDLGEYVIVISNTNKRRGLADSKYNERRGECEAALALLQKECDINALCELDVKTFEAHKHLISDPILLKRASHAVYENARTLAAVKVLNDGDIVQFGKMMNDSHASLRDLYEVTGTELDTLAAAAQKADGVLGSRMTGAGFGGCTVSIVRGDAVTAFKESVSAEYPQADFYVAETGDGAGCIV